MTKNATPAGDQVAPVLIEQRGSLGLITLNRPRAMNALTHEMVQLIATALENWRFDNTIETVAIVGSGERGLCAGGDIIALRNDATTGDGSSSARFWADEYAMNALIASYPKPYVAIQDGIVLGGGIGISAHGSHRIVTERSKVGFPEVGIGYIPDVGASWLLSRAPGKLGTRIALSGESVGAADAILIGLADTFLHSDHIPALLASLEHTSADEAIGVFASEPPAGILGAAQQWTDAAFSGESIGENIRALRAAGDGGIEEATELAKRIARHSPIALAVTLESLQRAHAYDSLEAALNIEYRVSLHALTHPDFTEGIRAQVIDKDRNPQWDPKDAETVTSASVEAFFQESPFGDLGLQARPTVEERA